MKLISSVLAAQNKMQIVSLIAITLTCALPARAQLTGNNDQLLVLGDLSGQLRGVSDGTFGGNGMVAGDLDCDGRDDLVVQQPTSLVNTDGGVNFIAGGQVTVIRTNGGAFPQPASSSFLHQAITNVPGIVETGDGFGAAAVIFNLDGAQCEDLFIGVPGEDVSGLSNAGAVHGFLGLPNSGASTVREGVFDGTAANEALGSALSSRGEFASTKLFVAKPGASSRGVAAAGQISQFGFSTDGQFLEALAPFDVGGTLLANDRWGTQMVANKTGEVLAMRSPRAASTAMVRNINLASPVFPIQRLTAGEELMAFGDFDGDGIEEFAQQFDFGGLRLWRRTSAAGDAGFTIQQTVPLIASTTEFLFFTSMTVGNFNGDGFDDLALGYPGNDLAGFGGRLIVCYGSPNGLLVSTPQILKQGENGIANIENPNDRFGASLAAGDFNGDGVGDLAVGVPGELRGAVERGGVHFLFGTPSPNLFKNGFE
jgi:hypothetical protein